MVSGRENLNMSYAARAMDRPVALESRQKLISSCRISEPDEAHAEVFLSHPEKQKPFVKDPYKDFSKWPRCRRMDPFFDQSGKSLPKGEEFPDRIFEAVKQSDVAVVILSKEYVTSKWPMLELLTFVEAQETSNPNLKLLPVFYDDLPTSGIDDSWIAAWENMKPDPNDMLLVGPECTTISIEVCMKALRMLRKSNGLVLRNDMSLKSLREEIVKEVVNFLPLHLQMDTAQQVEAFGYEKQGTPSLIEVDEHLEKLKTSILQSHGGDKASYFGLQGRDGAGKMLLAQMLNDDDDIQVKYEKDCVIPMNLDGCRSLEALPESIDNFNSLRELDLGGSEFLKALPKSIGNWSSRVELNLSVCNSLEALPESIVGLNSLFELVLHIFEGILKGHWQFEFSLRVQFWRSWIFGGTSKEH